MPLLEPKNDCDTNESSMIDKENHNWRINSWYSSTDRPSVRKLFRIINTGTSESAVMITGRLSPGRE